jgi:hypothetical protein
MAACLLQDPRLRSVLPKRPAARRSGGDGLPPRPGGAAAAAAAAQAKTLQHVAELAAAGHYQDLDAFTADVARVCEAARWVAGHGVVWYCYCVPLDAENRHVMHIWPTASHVHTRCVHVLSVHTDCQYVLSLLRCHISLHLPWQPSCRSAQASYL